MCGKGLAHDIRGEVFTIFPLNSNSSGLTKPAHRKWAWADPSTSLGHEARTGISGAAKKGVSKVVGGCVLRGEVPWTDIPEQPGARRRGGVGWHLKRTEACLKGCLSGLLSSV